ncbi:MAG: hypothetical protein L3J71_09365 [Victivallaceae bacterium]|nr:hypothetical protein [Victivallaceae bacterium]
MLGFSYTMFFTHAFSSAHVMPLSDAILADFFLPQIMAGAAMVSLLPRGCSIWLTIPLVLMAATMVSLVEARLLLGMANLFGKLKPITWLGRQNTTGSTRRKSNHP